MGTKKIAMKPYLDKISAYCEALTAAELKAVILSLAKDIPTAERVDFLNKIQACLPDSSPAMEREVAQTEAILEDIEALKESIDERIDAIEDGSYWDDPDDGDYYDEDPDYISEDQFHELTSFFGNAEDLFLDDRLAEAREVYQALFGLIETFSEISDRSLGDGVDIREARARLSIFSNPKRPRTPMRRTFTSNAS